MGLTPHLARFCRLRTSSGSFEQAEDELRSTVPEGAPMAPDCEVVVPFFTVLNGPFDREDALKLAGRPVGEVRFSAPKSRVVVVDSAPSSTEADWFQKGPPGSEHGRAVGGILRALACPLNSKSSICAYETVSEQALFPRTGGVRGSFSELAGAIDRAVHGAPRPDRLIINLSVGWDPTAEPEHTDPRRSMGPALGVVHRALQLATCRGVLVVAASGSEYGWIPASKSDVTYPAAWSTTTRPDDVTCRSWFDPSLAGPAANDPLPSASAPPGLRASDCCIDDDSLPLVFAVGASGIYRDPDAKDVQALAIQRPGATPTLFAFGGFSEGPAAMVSSAVAWMWAATPPGELSSQVFRDFVGSADRFLPRSRSQVVLPLAASYAAGQPHLVRPCRVLENHCGGGACDFETEAPLGCSRPSEPAFREPTDSAVEHRLRSDAKGTCPERPRVTVFSDAESVRQVCRQTGGADRPRLRPGPASCRVCWGRAPIEAKTIRVVLDLLPGAAQPAAIAFSSGRSLAVYPVSALELSPGKVHVLTIDLPGPIPGPVTGRVFFERDGRGFSEEIFLETGAVRP